MSDGDVPPQDPVRPQQTGGWQPVNTPPPQGGQGYGGYPPPPPPGYPPPPPGYVPYGAPQAGLSPTAAAAIAYITFIPAIIFLAIEPYRRDPYVRFHAWQSIVLSGVHFVGSLLFAGTHWVLRPIHLTFHVLLFVFWLIAIVKASQGERYHVPIVGDAAESLAASVNI